MIWFGIRFRVTTAKHAGFSFMGNANKTKPVVFVSHSGCNDYLNALCRYLPECEVVISDWRDKAGTQLAQEVREDIVRSDLVVVVLTDRAVASAWVNQEIGFAIGSGKRILPVLCGAQLPALLMGIAWEAYEPSSVEASALRAALRIARLLQEDVTRVFGTYHDYREWWTTVDERMFTKDKCYWATPHDTWVWIMAHVEQEHDSPWRTLIRGGLDFDRLTLQTHYEGEEAVCGVELLSAFEEVAVLGALSVETLWEPAACRELDIFLRSKPGIDELFRWYRDASHRPTTIEVRLVLDESRAARHRHRLDWLFEQYSNPKASS